MFIIHYQNMKDILGSENTIQYTKKGEKGLERDRFAL